MKVLVPGGCGMIGYHISKMHLDRGDEVVVMDNLERSVLLDKEVSWERRYHNWDLLTKAGAHCHGGDVSIRTEWPHFFRADRVYHVAAQTSVPASMTHPTRDFEINTLGVQHMLEYARRCGSKVVYASTNKVYPIHDEFVKDENNKWEWEEESFQQYGFPKDGHGYVMEGARTPYGNTKYMGDLLCQEYYHSFDVPTGIFRMSCIFGTHQFAFEEQGWITWFVIANLKGLPLKIFGDGDQVRDVLWVEDVVRAYDFFMNSNKEHGIWQLGGGPKQAISLNEALELIEKITGKKFVKIEKADWRPADQRIYTSDIDPIAQDLGWTPTLSIEEGLGKVARWAEGILEVF